jgi:hypothetical protein
MRIQARRRLAAVVAALVLVEVEAHLDPTSLLALSGLSGAVPETWVGLWPFAPYAVFLQVFLVVIWRVTPCAGERLQTLVVGVGVVLCIGQGNSLRSATLEPIGDHHGSRGGRLLALDHGSISWKCGTASVPLPTTAH